MSNEEIIVKSAISAGIFSEEEAAAYIMNGLRLPIHTFSEWKNLGCMVKKGEHAALTVSIWKPKTRKKKDEKNVEADKEENSGFFLTTAYLFTKQQVEAIKPA
jgi:antirestriction protein ArdC